MTNPRGLNGQCLSHFPVADHDQVYAGVVEFANRLKIERILS